MLFVKRIFHNVYSTETMCIGSMGLPEIEKNLVRVLFYHLMKSPELYSSSIYSILTGTDLSSNRKEIKKVSGFERSIHNGLTCTVEHYR